jgi:pimeloyl-ACP methyl ester carboxylesterase
MRWLVIAAGAVTLSACVAGDRYRNARAPDLPKITVLVPGYQGSFLYDGDTRVWIAPREALARGDLSLGSCETGRVPLQPGGPISGFLIFPVNVDIYGGFMQWADRRLPGFVGFGYDWRISLLDSAQQLCDFIGPRHADLIGHSMGGLVTRLALQRCPEKIDRVVFAGTPFGGAPGIFDDLFEGTQTVNNTALLSAKALWTFSSSWQVLPVEDDFFVDADGKPATVGISNADNWNNWPKACPALLEERLHDRALMREAMKMPLASTPHALVVIGKGGKAVDAVRYTPQGFDFRHPLAADADGTVVVRRATPPFAPERVVYTEAQHVALLNDPTVRAAVEEFLK